MRRHGRRVHDHAAAILGHEFSHRLKHIEDPIHVDVHDALEVRRIVALGFRKIPLVARVVEEIVDLPEGLLNLRGGLSDGLAVGDVDLEPMRMTCFSNCWLMFGKL